VIYTNWDHVKQLLQERFTGDTEAALITELLMELTEDYSESLP
jgi:hypothetical protein